MNAPVPAFAADGRGLPHPSAPADVPGRQRVRERREPGEQDRGLHRRELHVLGLPPRRRLNLSTTLGGLDGSFYAASLSISSAHFSSSFAS